MIAVSSAAARRRRLAANYLCVPAAAARLPDVVAAVGGIQAQVMFAAELAIAVRVAGVTRSDVAASLWERRELVKTYGPLA